MAVSTTINIKPHLKVFLGLKYEIDPYKLSMKDTFGAFLHNVFVRPIANGYHKEVKDYGENLEVVIPNYLVNQNFYEVDDRVNRLINSYLSKSFQEEFIQRAEDLKRHIPSIEYKDLICTIRREMNMDEELINYYTLEKAYKRFRDKKAQKQQKNSTIY